MSILQNFAVALVLFVMGALTWRNPRRHFPKAWRELKEGRYAGVYLGFPVYSVIAWIGAVIMAALAISRM